MIYTPGDVLAGQWYLDLEYTFGQLYSTDSFHEIHTFTADNPILSYIICARTWSTDTDENDVKHIKFLKQDGSTEISGVETDLCQDHDW